MLFLRVLSVVHTWTFLLPGKRGLQSVGPSSLTRLGWFRLPPIDQYSSLLPPVGVWSVSQYQCGGPSSQNPYASSAWWSVTPPNYLMRRMPIRNRIAPLTDGRCLPSVLCGIRRDFSRLSPCYGQVAYVLLTRAPVAGR